MTIDEIFINDFAKQLVSLGMSEEEALKTANETWNESKKEGKK